MIAVAALAGAVFPVAAKDAKSERTTQAECRTAFKRSSAASSCFDESVTATGNSWRIIARCLIAAGGDKRGVVDDTISRVPGYHNCNGTPRYGGCGKDEPKVVATEEVKARRAALEKTK